MRSTANLEEDQENEIDYEGDDDDDFKAKMAINYGSMHQSKIVDEYYEEDEYEEENDYDEESEEREHLFNTNDVAY